jgi:hypothetical protein
MFCWSEERVASLQKLAGEGLSYGIIAERLGVSRNSVIGKANRLGLKGRSGQNFSDDALARKLKKKRALLVRRMKAAAKSLAKAKKAATPKTEVTPDIRALIAIPTNNFLARKAGCCKWPHDDCLEASLPMKPYCAEHYARSRIRG